MRYYDIKIYQPADSKKNQPRTLYKQYSSLKNGVFNPGALMVEFDIQRVGESTPKGETQITIWGIGPKEMQQARQNMFGMEIEMRVGMSAGLPLANPLQQGLVLKGTIWQPFGNWQGTDLRLDLIVTAGPVSPTDPKPLASLGLSLPWTKGRKLSDALFDCFRTLGGYSFKINISDRLIRSYDQHAFNGNLEELAKFINSASRDIITDSNYRGVEITVVNGNEIRVFDNDFSNHPDTSSKDTAGYRNDNPKQIEFIDLIGQPTWIKYNTVSIPCVMRGDIQVGDYILMPKNSRPMIQASSYSHFRDDSAFTGKFQVNSVRLLGNSRQADGNSWITILEAVPEQDSANEH